MAESYDVSVKVISQKGTCEAGHKIGDEWIINHKPLRVYALRPTTLFTPLPVH